MTLPGDLSETQVSSQRVFQGRIISLRVDEARLSNGQRARREVVDHPGAVAIVALLEGDRVLLVRQWRYAAGEELLEIPAGALKPGESPVDCARRELVEETGHAAGSMEPLVTVYSAPGFTTERMHLFVARDLTPASAAADEDEIIEPLAVPWDEAVAMCLDGRIRDAKSVAGILAVAERRRGLVTAPTDG